MKDGFKILIASDTDYEKVFAEIYYNEKFVALISQEQGVDRMKVEFPRSDMNESMVLREIDLEGFQEALYKAAKKLKG